MLIAHETILARDLVHHPCFCRGCMTKFWVRANEWFKYAKCGGDYRFTSDSHSVEELHDLGRICKGCGVRPECIQTALREEWSSVVVAGVPLPDPACKRGLKRIYGHLREILPEEFERRGEDV